MDAIVVWAYCQSMYRDGEYTIHYIRSGTGAQKQTMPMRAPSPMSAASRFCDRVLGTFAEDTVIDLAVIEVTGPEWGCYELFWWRGEWRITETVAKNLKPVTISHMARLRRVDLGDPLRNPVNSRI